MEEKLKSLIRTCDKENRTKWVKEWKKQGKKVIGVLDSMVPEETIYAAGMLPWRIQGTMQEDVSLATMYRPIKSCAFINHTLESFMEGKLDFLDGLVCTNRDQDFIRFWDICNQLGKIPFVYILDVPIMDFEVSRRRFAAEIRNFMSSLEQFGKVKIDDASLSKAIKVYDKGRTLLRKIYELRKKKVPPVSGGEALAITSAAMVMPMDEFIDKVEQLLPYLKTRKANISQTQPRVLLSSDLLDNSAYIDLVEEAGCLVAMDDMDTGSRYFWEKVGDGKADPIYALAARYLKNRSPRMLDWQEQAEQLVQWCKDFNIDGVLDLPEMYDYPRGFRRPFLEGYLKQAGISEISFDRDYHLANVGQLKTRIGAFLEILESKSGK
jgi:benzoyl-CoA reductase/2-hydroxyglutaryl-CoA dehydratase subunit BcrC/BadD/HgdB